MTGASRERLTADRRRFAFTLLEVLAVLVLTAILTTIAAVSLRQSARQANERDAAERLASFDQLARRDSRASGQSCRLVFEVGGVAVRKLSGDADTIADAPVLQLGGRQTISGISTPGSTVSAGEAEVVVSGKGFSQSYVIELSGPAGRQWLLMPGLGGGQVVLRDADEAQNILAALSAGHDDR